MSQALELRRAARAARRSNDSHVSHIASLEDSVVQKGFPSFMEDAFDAVSDAANSMVDYAQEIGGSLMDVGLSVGSFAANSALVIGRSVVKVAEQSYAAVPASIKAVASQLGSALVVTGQWVTQAAQSVAKVTAKLARDSLAAATKSIQQGVDLAVKVGNTIEAAAATLEKVGDAALDVAKKMGPMVVDMAKATWDAIKEWVASSSLESRCALFSWIPFVTATPAAIWISTFLEE